MGNAVGREPTARRQIGRSRSAGQQMHLVSLIQPMCERRDCAVDKRDPADCSGLVSEFEENMSSFEHLEIQLETFVENLLFD